MSNWLHNLPIFWMAILVCGATFIFTAAIYGIVVTLATDKRTPKFKSLSPGLLSPLGSIFSLFVVFTAVQVWNDNDRANSIIDRESSSLKAAMVLSGSLPKNLQESLDAQIASHIEEVASQEWPTMARQDATLTKTPLHLLQAIQMTLEFSPGTQGQITAQRMLADTLNDALDARRQRILLSRSQVSPLKWICLMVQAGCLLFVIGLLHCEDRRTCRTAMGLFSASLAVCLLLILVYDRPFVGETTIGPGPLLQVLPEIPKGGAIAAPNNSNPDLHR